MADIVQFRTRAQQKDFAEIDANQAEWERVCKWMIEILQTSWLSPSEQASATAQALVSINADVLPDIKLTIELAMAQQENWKCEP
jgi:hypothetical protein